MANIPTAFEQLMLEYTNQARLNPTGEYDLVIDTIAVDPNIANAISYFGVDLDAYRTQMQAFDPVAPLAWDTSLAAAADGHSELMIVQDTQSHLLDGESSLGARITDAGYTGWASLRENIYAFSDDALYAHIGFMVDWGFDGADFDADGFRYDDWQTIGDGIQEGAGHRVSIMLDGIRDIGISAIEETDPATAVGDWVITQNFGRIWGDTDPVLLGVFIDDVDGDAFYDIGEGRGGITVTATETTTGAEFVTTTWESGGYQLDLVSGTYAVAFSSAEWSGSASYSVTLGDENVKLDGFLADVLVPDYSDVVDLAEGMEAVYFPEVSAQVFRLYQAVLGRDPDSTGHLAWTERLAIEGRELIDVVNGFVGSGEFQTNYGGLDNAEFVTLMYQNVLGRDPDATGLARWVGDLEDGTERAEVVLGFSESAEFTNNTAAAAQSFTRGNSPSEWGDDVFRLYQATLDRAPDATGFTNWSGKLGSGVDYLTVANGFVSSAEFQATYGSLTDEEFVTLLYTNVLDRTPDVLGLANWIQRLADGMSEVEAVKGFAQSAEFIANTQSAFFDWVTSQGIDDEVVAGQGVSVLAGGRLADQFVFNPNQNTTTVLDLEAWDVIDLSLFDLANDAAAMELFEQQGDDVVFEDLTGTTIRFVDADLSILSDEMILV